MQNKNGSKDTMHGIEIKRNKDGDIIAFKFRCCVGRDELCKQIWRTATVSPDDVRLEDYPRFKKKYYDALIDIKREWDKQQKAEYERTHSKEDKARITLFDFVKGHWWPDHVMDGSHTPSSIAFYRNMSNDILSYFGDKKRLADIKMEDIKRYTKYLNTEAKTKRGEPLSSTTKVRHYQTLKNIINYALRFGYLKEDPCKMLTINDKPTKDSKQIDFLSPKDAQRFIKALEEEPLFWRTFETVLITCGLRRGEALGLQWDDIDKEKLEIRVCRNITIDQNAAEKYHVGKPKNGKERTVPLSPRVYSLLMSLKLETEEKIHAKLTPRSYIFCSSSSPYRPTYPTEPTRWQSKFVKRHSLPNVSPHDLRHTAATLALEGGADLKQVQELLGHEDPATTMAFYAGVTEEAKRRTVEGIEKVISQA